MSGMRKIGRFISFEGGEGTGKSTQVKALAEWLRAQGKDVVTTREPGGSEGGESIRGLLVTGDIKRWDATSEALLLYAARHDHVERLIKPALERGAWVVCDRLFDSTTAYQGFGYGFDRDWLDALRRHVLGSFAPDLTLVLDLPVEAGLDRALVAQRYEKMGRDFHEKLRQGYLAIAGAEPGRCALIDANRPLADVTVAVNAAVTAKFGPSLE